MSKDDLFPAAAPDFSDQLGLLGACHERILKHCVMVEKLADSANRDHAHKENRELLETAAHIFNSDELKQIGQAMAERCGVKQP